MSRAADPNFPQGLRIQPSSKARPSSDPSSYKWQEDTEKDIVDYGIAGRIWEAAYLLALYFASEDGADFEFDPPCSVFLPASSTSVRAVELGSGAGFGGLHLAQQLVKHRSRTRPSSEADLVVLSDLPNVVPLMERNAKDAGLLSSDAKASTDQGVHVLVRPLAWGDKQHADKVASELVALRSGHPLTHVVCSDLVYFPELLPPLMRSLIDLTDLASGPDGVAVQVIISYKIRSLIKEQPFWSAFGAWFDYQAVDCRRRRSGKEKQAESEEWHRFGSLSSDLVQQGKAVGHGVPAEGPADELFVFVAQRRPESLGCKAPTEDTALMDGKRMRMVENDQGEAEWHMEDGNQGQDLFEWILLSGMGAGL